LSGDMAKLISPKSNYVLALMALVRAMLRATSLPIPVRCSH
jgi:hypothetical protein